MTKMPFFTEEELEDLYDYFNYFKIKKRTLNEKHSLGMVSQPTHPIIYLRAANHRRGFKSVVCETHLGNVI